MVGIPAVVHINPPDGVKPTCKNIELSITTTGHQVPYAIKLKIIGNGPLTVAIC